MRGAVIYYTCNTHKPDIELACRLQLQRAKGGLELVTVSRGGPIDFGDTRLEVYRKRSAETMHYQVLEGLQATDADYVYLCESDVLYPPDHFQFQPPTDDAYYYDTNVWKVWYDTGHAVWTDNLQQVSACCANRKLLLHNYERRTQRIEQEGGKFSVRWGYEPGSHRLPRGFDNYPTKNWQSAVPQVCIRHDSTLTRSKQAPEEFRNPKYARGWTERDDVPHWGATGGRFPEFLQEIIARNQPVVV